MDKVKKIFDEWAESGRAELMQKEHAESVKVMLNSMSFDKPFSFLDIGCGNGWVVHKVSQNKNCKKAVGIDKSKNMIKNAKLKSTSKKESFETADIEEWNYKGKFDYIFSMEVIYYVNSIDTALSNTFRLLKKGGKFFCGIDFYSDNRATQNWSKKMNVKMHLHSKKEWREFFTRNGFETKIKNVKNPKSSKKWKRDFGTLLIIGTKL